MAKNIPLSSLHEYDAPPWMSENLHNVPTHRVKASVENTPIQRWHLPGVPEGIEVYIKREDLTGSVLSGNKVRGLEFFFGDAIKRGCTAVSAWGPTQSNFLRTLSIMASQVGLQSHLVVYGDNDAKVGNNLLQWMSGAHRYLIPNVSREEFNSPDNKVSRKQRHLVKKLREETGEDIYMYSSCGTNPYCYGYLHVFDEMLRQDVESFSDIVLGTSSCATTCGLALGSHLNGCKIKIHAYVTGKSVTYANKGMNDMLKYVGLQKSDGSGLSEDDLDVRMTDCVGSGYGVMTVDELDFIKQVAGQTGIYLGPTYSGKAAYYLVKALNQQPDTFRGKKILFIHTGGLFELFDGRVQEAFETNNNEEFGTTLETIGVPEL